jgi:hypothetical protein
MSRCRTPPRNHGCTHPRVGHPGTRVRRIRASMTAQRPPTQPLHTRDATARHALNDRRAARHHLGVVELVGLGHGVEVVHGHAPGCGGLANRDGRRLAAGEAGNVPPDRRNRPAAALVSHEPLLDPNRERAGAAVAGVLDSNRRRGGRGDDEVGRLYEHGVGGGRRDRCGNDARSGVGGERRCH